MIGIFAYAREHLQFAVSGVHHTKHIVRTGETFVANPSVRDDYFATVIWYD